MDSVWAEKKIQALFSELSLEDQGSIPRFESLWAEAATTTRQPTLNIGMTLVAILLAVFVGAGVYLASRSTKQPGPAITEKTDAQLSQPILNMPEPEAAKNVIAVAHPRVKIKRPKRVMRMDRAERALASEVAQLSRWQSPTSAFMSSPGVSQINSLPQLDQSINELRQFLSTDNE